MTADCARADAFRGWAMAARVAGLILASPLWAAGAPPEEARTPVPRRPNLRVVDYGADLGGGLYRDATPQALPGPGGAGIDADGDGRTDDDTLSGWPYTLARPLSPAGDYYNTQAPSARYYGGLIGIHANQPGAKLTEGMLNENHELRDDSNLMSSQSPAANLPGRFVQAWALWLWLKPDFLNGGDAHPVRFDADSLLAVHVSRYWDDIDLGRWVVREGERFYISEQTFGSAGDIAARGRKTRLSWILRPAATRWAPYEPAEPDRLRFDPAAARFEPREFRDVTAAGFYMAKDSKTPGVIAVKWHSFECFAVVDKPDALCDRVPMSEVAGGAAAPAFAISRGPVPYGVWRRVRDWSVSNQYCDGLDPSGYTFDRDGDAGPMQVAPGPRGAADPATDLTWLDAVLWCNALSELEGRAPCYYEDEARTRVLRTVRERGDPAAADWRPDVYAKRDADGFRLPTAAEWQAATRAGAVAAAEGVPWVFVWDAGGDAWPAAAGVSHRALPLGGAGAGTPEGRRPVSPGGASPIVGFGIARTLGAAAAAPAPAAGGWAVPGALPPIDDAATPPDVLGGDDFAVIAGGRFERDDEATVTVTDFQMGKREVSYAEWNAVRRWAEPRGYRFDAGGSMGSLGWDPEAHAHAPDEPVTDVGWFDAAVWCNALSERQGRAPVYHADAGCTEVLRRAHPWRIRMEQGSGVGVPGAQDRPVFAKWEADGYRLPTWAEWCVAWREGNTNRIAGGLDEAGERRAHERGWLRANAGGRTRPCATKPANGYGLFDLEGNVSEWLHDTPVDDYYRPDDPRGDARDSLFGTAIAGPHFNGAAAGIGRRPAQNRKSAAWPWLGFRVVRCEAGAHREKPFVPKVVLDVAEKDFDPLQGRTFRANLMRTGWFGERGLPARPAVKWTFKTGGPVEASPVAADGLVVVGGMDGTLYGLDAATGAPRWTFDAGSPISGSATIDRAGTVYVGCGGGWLFAIDARTGAETWRYARDPSNPGRFPVTTSPAVAFGTVFAAFGTHGGAYGGVEAATGREVWRLRGFSPNAGRLAPTIVGTRLVAPVNDILIAVVDLRTQLPERRGNGHHCLASIPVADGLLYYSGGSGCRIEQFEDGRALIDLRVPGGGLSFFPQSGPAVHDGMAYFAKGDNRIHAFRIADGVAKEAWSAPTPKEVRSSIAVAGGEVFFGCDDGAVYALDRLTGAERWSFKTGGPVASSPGVADGVLYVGSEDGTVYALE